LFDDHPVYFRPHPVAKKYYTKQPLIEGSLDHALTGASAAWTWNSNSAVEAILAGVPNVVTFDPGSIVYDFTSHDIHTQMEPINRELLVDHLARRQWSLAELADGSAWDCIKQGAR